MNPLEQLDLVEQQIRTLNQSQKVYPVKNEELKVRLSSTKLHYWYKTNDEWLDLMLDSIILHQSLVDDYIIQVWAPSNTTAAKTLKEEHTDEDEPLTQNINGEIMLFETYITKECYDKIKKLLDSEK